MRLDIVIGGVGGQGILTVARIVSQAAIARGMQVKQAEVHGMSQRGGAVFSHLRLSDGEIFSDLIPAGRADMVLAVEPLEALRYVPMLRKNGSVVASTNAVANIQNYPTMEKVLDHVAAFENHVCIDMEKLARAAGSPLAANVVALGAASLYLPFSSGELEHSVEVLFQSKGERAVLTNVRAFRFGRRAAAAYREAIQRGAAPQKIRGWIDTLSADHLAAEDDLEFNTHDAPGELDRLSGAEAHAFENVLMEAYDEGRRQLYEHEVYSLIELVGAISPPRHMFVPKGSTIPEDILEQFPGSQVVVKLVSEDVVHKSDAGAVAFVTKSLESVRGEIDRMVAAHSAGARVAGTLVVEKVEKDEHGLGSELFVGIRATREFGPVIAAGLGGTATEYLASRMKPGAAVAKATALDTSAEEFLEMFRETVAYDMLAGRVRGHERQVGDAELLRCFRAFISIARQFCVDRGEEGPDIAEMEVNPFAFRGERLVPLDGRGRLEPCTKARIARPPKGIDSLLEPKSIAMVGISSKPDSFGQIILNNTIKAGFPAQDLRVVKPDTNEINGVPCVAGLKDLSGETDLLVIATPASAVPELLKQANEEGRIHAAIAIAGGAGEAAGTEEIGHQLAEQIQASREKEGLVLLGPNCMGIRSRPGLYDTFFIPESKLPSHHGAEFQKLALVSQSGAFAVSRLSSLSHLNPGFSVSLGNQADISCSDILWGLSRREDAQVIGVYLEGFADLDGLETVAAIRELRANGRFVAFYKAGRTESGRSAAAGHTASVAGDYDICQTALAHAGAFVAADFQEFSQMLELATFLEGRKTAGKRLFAITNAGMESVGMADHVPAGSFQNPSSGFSNDLTKAIQQRGLQTLVSARNPLDLTPAATEAAYDDIVKLALASEEVDALIVSCVPLAPELKTLEDQIGDPGAFPALAREWLSYSGKPILFVVDGGHEYDALASRLRDGGLPVFRSADQAVKRLAQFLG